MFCCTEIWVTQYSPKVRPISNLNNNNSLITPIWATNQTLQARRVQCQQHTAMRVQFGAVVFEKSSKTWSVPPIFGLLGDLNFSQNRAKRQNGAMSIFLNAIPIHSVVTDQPKPLWRSGKKIPPRHKGQGDLCVLTKTKLKHEFHDSAKNEKLLSSRKQSIPNASGSQTKP